jgi:hypothetical protein
VNTPHSGQANPIDTGTQPAAFDHAPRDGLSLTSTSDSLVFFPLLCIYVVLVHFGSLIKFAGEEGGRGGSTIIILALIVLGARRALQAFLAERIFWVLGILLLYLLIPSAIAATVTYSLTGLTELTGYVLLAAAVSRTRLVSSQLLILWVCMGGALLLSSGLTIVDQAGIVDVPYNNEYAIVTQAEGQAVEQASGFFARRSAMAAIFAITISGSLALALAHGSLRVRLYFLAAGISGLLCLFLTHNRSGVLGSAGVIAVYALLSPRFRGFRRIGIIMAAVLLGAISIAIVVRYYPEHASVYLAKLGFLGLAETTWESDTYRVDLFNEAIRSLGVRPLGNGFTKIEMLGGLLVSPHNVMTMIIWAAGLFSFIWIPLFGITLYSYLGRRFGRRSAGSSFPVESDAVSCGLFAWLVNGMTHQSLFTALAWILFGVMVSIRFFSERPRPDPAAGTDAPIAEYRPRNGPPSPDPRDA